MGPQTDIVAKAQESQDSSEASIDQHTESQKDPQSTAVISSWCSMNHDLTDVDES